MPLRARLRGEIVPLKRGARFMKGLHRRTLIAAGLCLPALRRAGAAESPLRIGVLTDLSGPYSGIAGQGSIACARQAVREAADAGLPAAEVVSADHHNDPAKGAAIARDWYANGVDLIVDVPNSEVALAVAAVARAANRAYINTGAATTKLTGAGCSPTTVHWSYDTHMLARSTGGALVRAGGSTWFFLAPDYAFGAELQAETSAQVVQAGGRILGGDLYPFPGTTDFKPLLRQAMQSNAQVLGLANAGNDVTSCVAQAHAEGICDETRVACLLMQLPDVHRLGLAKAEGLMLTESFYWDLNDRTRAFTQRLMDAQSPPGYPDMIQAGCYAGTLHFLKAVAALGVGRARDGAAVVAKMKSMPTDDDAFGPASIRRDGRVMVPAMLFEVKSEDESTGPWDYYRQVSTTPPDAAFGPLPESVCTLAKA
jgi:branched-chain amino acid transport system substrate-binding protein